MRNENNVKPNTAGNACFMWIQSQSEYISKCSFKENFWQEYSDGFKTFFQSSQVISVMTMNLIKIFVACPKYA